MLAVKEAFMRLGPHPSPQLSRYQSQDGICDRPDDPLPTFFLVRPYGTKNAGKNSAQWRQRKRMRGAQI
ncbi:hypothetical protein RRG08_011088 [Elysia crispata]|uniref:Uncharacterized protein n=1 Tax=Elysia crispata TaxID=231223 RepID=A0AAE1DC52_9GAST|nr:hypothetical protein RRG08_011088 [Elysia crispata]